VWSKVRILKSFILHGKLASVFRQSVLSVYCQLHVAFLMLPTKNYKHMLNFVKIIKRNTVSFFLTSDTIKTTFLMS